MYQHDKDRRAMGHRAENRHNPHGGRKPVFERACRAGHEVKEKRMRITEYMANRHAEAVRRREEREQAAATDYTEVLDIMTGEKE